MVRSAAQRFRRCAVAVRRGDAHPEKSGTHGRREALHPSMPRAAASTAVACLLSGPPWKRYAHVATQPRLTANRALHDTCEQGTVSTPSARTTLEITTISVGDRDQH